MQWIHYPFFKHLDKSTFSQSMAFHQHRIAWVVIPVMLTELITGILIAINQWSTFPLLNLLNITSLVIIWIQTTIQMPQLHGKLLTQFSDAQISYLVKTNRIRTTLWCLRALYWSYISLHAIYYI